MAVSSPIRGRTDLLPADVVLPTFSTAINETFQAMQPVLRRSVAILNELLRFRQEFHGEIWLEVFIIPDINTTERELAGLRDAIHAISPDRVQLNTLDAETDDWVRPPSPDEAARIAPNAHGFPETGLSNPHAMRISTHE